MTLASLEYLHKACLMVQLSKTHACIVCCIIGFVHTQVVFVKSQCDFVIDVARHSRCNMKVSR